MSNVREELITDILISRDLMDLKDFSIRIFALDSRTIGLSNKPPDSWLEQCLWENITKAVIDEDNQTVLLPQEIISFYQPVKIDISVDVNKTRILLVVNALGSGN